MFWRKKIKDPRKGDLNALELTMVNYLISFLSQNYKEKLKAQLKYLCLIRRIRYKNDITVELYPERFGGIPESVLFDKKEEFCIGRIKVRAIEQLYEAKIYFVLGTLFEIRIKPPSQDIDKLKESDIELISYSIDEKFVDSNNNGI